MSTYVARLYPWGIYKTSDTEPFCVWRGRTYSEACMKLESLYRFAKRDEQYQVRYTCPPPTGSTN